MIKTCKYCKKEYESLKDSQKYCSLDCYHKNRVGKTFNRKYRPKSDLTKEPEKEIDYNVSNNFVNNFVAMKAQKKLVEIIDKMHQIKQKYPLKLLELTVYPKSDAEWDKKLYFSSNNVIITYIYDKSKESPNYIGGSPQTLKKYFDCDYREAIICYFVVFLEYWYKVSDKKVKFLLLDRALNELKKYAINYKKVCKQCNKPFETKNSLTNRCNKCIEIVKQHGINYKLKKTENNSKKAKKASIPKTKLNYNPNKKDALELNGTCESCGAPINNKFDFCEKCAKVNWIQLQRI